jgi:uncharacterized protein YfaS (alpha-2-macroglobulin family)
MSRLSSLRAVRVVVMTAVAASCLSAAEETRSARDTALQHLDANNNAEAYSVLRRLALDPADDPLLVGSDLENAVLCLKFLHRVGELDDLREQVITVHRKNWRLLTAAAMNYIGHEHTGSAIAGKFVRCDQRAGIGACSARLRDHVRALQLMQEALPLTKTEPDRHAVALFHLLFAGILVNDFDTVSEKDVRRELFPLARWLPRNLTQTEDRRNLGNALNFGFEANPIDYVRRLSRLTDSSNLPDFEDSRGSFGDTSYAAPVSADGKPIVHHVPASYEAAKTDGERWRWNLAQAALCDPLVLGDAEMGLARFLRDQFDVQTMAVGSRWPGDAAYNRAGTYAIHTLADDETIARLATGVQRFKLPNEFNWIKTCQRVAARGRSRAGEAALDLLAQIYEDRRQYPKAAAAWKRGIEQYSAWRPKWREWRLDRIVGNWGRFERGVVQAAGSQTRINYRFRNGHKVSFEARAIDVPRLLRDLRTSVPAPDSTLALEGLGAYLIEMGETKYFGEVVASWNLALHPRPDHVDDRITVTTPLQKPGAYLLTARMEGGNQSQVIVWVSDTVLVRKSATEGVYYFVADAATGAPVPNAEVECFNLSSAQTFSRLTDATGQVFVKLVDLQLDSYDWIVTARTKADPVRPGRFAYLGFSPVWYGDREHDRFETPKMFTITDRPVYRPGQPVRFKLWVRENKFDEADTSSFAHARFTVTVRDPSGKAVFSKDTAADDYGGLAGEYTLPTNTPLGQYTIHAYHDTVVVAVHSVEGFRVEEYKKPEFEVTVDAPAAVRLGDRATATIKSRYYFGAPVTKAKVRCRVVRSVKTNSWYPAGAWDWLYGRGYGSFVTNYRWYPGWAGWGWRKLRRFVWDETYEQPELVAENETEIGPDGTVKVAIDTLPAKELFPDQDHRYTITAEVTDQSRRTIVGTGEVSVGQKPFQVFASVDHGFYRNGDVIDAGFYARTIDDKPVAGSGVLALYKVSPNGWGGLIEKAVGTWKLDSDAAGEARRQLKASGPGQFRLSYTLTNRHNQTVEGGYLFVVRDDTFDGRGLRFNDLELVTDKREYAPGDKVRLQINTNQPDATVLLFVRPVNGVYPAPKVIHLHGKSTTEEVVVTPADVPNFFIEAVTVARSRAFTEVREVAVPPKKRVLNVDVRPSRRDYKPGEKATLRVKLTDAQGKPFVGSAAVTVYDKSLEYIAGDDAVTPDIKEFFWKWRRTHDPVTVASTPELRGELRKFAEPGYMGDIGVFGESVVEELTPKGSTSAPPPEPLPFETAQGFGALGAVGGVQLGALGALGVGGVQLGALGGLGVGGLGALGAVGGVGGLGVGIGGLPALGRGGPIPAKPSPASALAQARARMVEPAVRKKFADAAFWAASLTTDRDGVAEMSLTMPENLTGWKVKVWAMGHGTRVGQGEAEITTKKDLLVRLQSPRFYVERDEVVLSANVHNYLKTDKSVRASLELDGGTLVPMTEPVQTMQVAATGERRVDWRVRVKSQGEAVVRVKAVTDEESDAMEMRFPCLVHGMMKTDTLAGALRPEESVGQLTLTVPAERRVDQARLEVRYAPTLAGAMIDALPYLVEYPHGCTEQTLNRFVPTVIVQGVLRKLNLDLKGIRDRRTNARPQGPGEQLSWRNPVFDEAEVQRMVAHGVDRLASMQVRDGGWGWFSGGREESWPHTTAVAVHGLQLAKENGVELPRNMLERGTGWLAAYRSRQLTSLRNAAIKIAPGKDRADDLDAFVHMVLFDGGLPDAELRDFLFRDRAHLSVYARFMLGLTLHAEGQLDKLAVLLKEIEPLVVQDDGSQTAYVSQPGGNTRWRWYANGTETQAYYLKLLTRTEPRSPTAMRLVKYLLNNRKYANYWDSTRATAVCIEALAEHLVVTGEGRPDMTVEVWLDDKKQQEARIDAGNLFSSDHGFALAGDALKTGRHILEFRKKGKGVVYFSAALTDFTREERIARSGQEVRVNRKYYKLTKTPHTSASAEQQYERQQLANLATLKSGDLVEVELSIDSADDYEYVLVEDPKAAGFEPQEVQSGYMDNELLAYLELRDDRACFFVRELPRGRHTVRYRLRAETPGRFSALPARISAMYAPDLRGNSDEMKFVVVD